MVRKIVVCFVACLCLVILPSFWLVSASPSPSHTYKYKTYKETVRFFEQLEKKYPHLLKVWVAQDLYPYIWKDRTKPWAQCDGETCKTLIVQVANRAKLTTATPEVYFSGALHGDERLGPLTVTELAALMCEKYTEGVPEFQRLLDGRSTWIMPMTNAEGYAHNHRVENGMDPNRDFAYLQQPSHCMMTQTARAVNELFRRHLFTYMITFHGGMRALTYEWGSRNHMKGGTRTHQSTESPDEQAFVRVGRAIQADAGHEKRGRLQSEQHLPFYYPLARITDAVYPVDGGMEDWSYGAGFESAAPKGPITICKPKTYGGYSADRTQYKKGNIATLVYLAEMDDAKTPNEKTLGSSAQVWSNTPNQGHIARHVRMCLRLIELTKPELVVNALPQFLQARAAPGPIMKFDIEVFGFGCLSLEAVTLLLIPRSLVADCMSLAPPKVLSWSTEARKAMLEASATLGTLPGPRKCKGMHLWEDTSTTDLTFALTGEAPAAVLASNQTYCLTVSAEFDQDWAAQKSPDPKLRPQSHAARLRLDEHYTAFASDGSMQLNEFKTKLFPVVDFEVRATAAGLVALPETKPVSPLVQDTGETSTTRDSSDATPAAANTHESHVEKVTGTTTKSLSLQPDMGAMLGSGTVVSRQRASELLARIFNRNSVLYTSLDLLAGTAVLVCLVRQALRSLGNPRA